MNNHINCHCECRERHLFFDALENVIDTVGSDSPELDYIIDEFNEHQQQQIRQDREQEQQARQHQERAWPRQPERQQEQQERLQSQNIFDTESNNDDGQSLSLRSHHEDEDVGANYNVDDHDAAEDEFYRQQRLQADRLREWERHRRTPPYDIYHTDHGDILTEIDLHSYIPNDADDFNHEHGSEPEHDSPDESECSESDDSEADSPNKSSSFIDIEDSAATSRHFEYADSDSDCYCVA